MAVINGGQSGVVIWQILRKFTAAVTTGGRYLSSFLLNGNETEGIPCPLIGNELYPSNLHAMQGF